MTFSFGTPFGPSQSAIKDTLNPEQKAVVFSTLTGTKVVMAGAGCGKTSGCILPRAEHLLKELPGTKAIIQAYNKKIQVELQEKVSNVVALEVNRGIDTMTSHALAKRLLDKYGVTLLNLPKGWELLSQDWMTVKFLKEQAKLDNQGQPWKHFHPMYTNLEDKQIIAMLGAEEKADAMDLPIHLVLKYFKPIKSLDAEFVLNFCTWAHAKRHKLGKLLFRDWLPLVNQLPDKCFEQLGYDHILVDEAQDLNKAQHTMVKRMAKFAQSVLFVGDAAQCIYRFAGSRPDVFLGIKEFYPDAETHLMETNYRSVQPVLDIANWVLKNYIKTPVTLKPPKDINGATIKVKFLEEAFIKLLETDMTLELTSPVTGKDIVLYPQRDGECAFPDAETLAAEMGVEIDKPIHWAKNLLASGVPLKDIAMLYRVNADAIELELDLLGAGIPYRSSSGTSFNHPVIEDIMTYVRFLRPQASRNEDDWKRIIQHRKYLGKLTAGQSWEDSFYDPLSLQKPPEACRTGNQKALFRSTQQFCRKVQAQLTHDIRGAVASIIEYLMESVWSERWANDPDEMRDAESLSDTFKLWTVKLCSNAAELVGLVDRIREWVENNDPENSITLSTVHKAKGLEWPHVAIWRVGSHFPFNHQFADPEEEACIFYVALTRAMKSLSLFVDVSPEFMPFRLSEHLCLMGHLAVTPGAYSDCDSCPMQLTCAAKDLT